MTAPEHQHTALTAGEEHLELPAAELDRIARVERRLDALTASTNSLVESVAAFLSAVAPGPADEPGDAERRLAQAAQHARDALLDLQHKHS